MTTKQEQPKHDNLRAEYDFSAGIQNPIASRVAEGTNLVLIEPDLFETFSSSEAVNQALRLLKQAASSALHRTAS